MTTPFLFVYGTLRRLAGHEAHSVLERNARFEGEGTVPAQLFSLGHYPGLVLSEDPSDRVLGEVYRLEPSHMDDTLQELDAYEGMGRSDPHPHKYRREVITVHLATGSTVDAWAYVLIHVPPGSPRIPSGDYLEWRAS
jgi:gamma-glutamylcyclotransferase (GGCT)/AIG2-like uncharacterized protein YtfP